MSLFAKHKSMRDKIRQGSHRALAGIVVASTMLTGSAFAAGGAGWTGGNTGGSGTYKSNTFWVTDDNLGSASDNEAVVRAIQSEGVAIGSSATREAAARAQINAALSKARGDCETEYTARGGTGSADCRIWGVGFTATTAGPGITKPEYNNTSSAQATGAQWLSAWNNETQNGTRKYNHGGSEYTVFDDIDSANTLASFAAQGMSTPNTDLIVIVLAKDQPKLWDFTPDKSWVKYSNGKWATVIDAKHTNTTGADTQTILDGDKLGSVVNGSLGENLGDSLDTFTLSDDYTAADYLWDPDMSDVHVYTAPIPEASTTVSSVDDIITKGTDVTSHFTIQQAGTTITATMTSQALAAARSLATPMQYTLLIGGKANYANGKGAAQVRADAGKKATDEVEFCADPTTGAALNSHGLKNKGSESAAGKTKTTNEPYVCGYVPPVAKAVISEASQGGDQDDINGKSVMPGQKLEYELTSEPTIPNNLSYAIESVAFTDTYDQYLELDKQTIELRDLETGRTISKKNYTLTADTEKHEFTIELNKDYVTANMTAGSKHRFQVRFEGTVSKNAPTDHSVDNQWGLKLNNSLTSSNVVSNKPVEPKPEKKDETKTGINIDGKTAYVGDDIYYRLTLSAATLKDTAYKVHRLGMIDDYDDEYLQLNDKNIEILDAAGKDVTNKFNIQVKDGVVYVFAKTVDTEYLGDILPGDPQPTDLKAYAGKVLDVTKDPAIDQSLLGQDYTIVLPMTVKQVKDGYVVKNTATQITNDRKDVTNTVTNPLKVINPKKDVTVKVNGESANGKSIYKDHQFLYRLDSSKIAGNRAYKQIKNWRIVDDYDEKFDKLTGQWAVYVNNDIKLADGTVISKGSRIDGSGVDAGYFTFTEANGAFTVEATQQFLDIASAMDSDLSWTAYVQMTRLGVSDRVENTFVETMNDVERESNMVWTKTPDQTPAIKLIKYDAASGLEAGDRNTPSEALKSTKNGTKIVFRIINTGKVNLTKITLDDKTIAGSGTVTNLEYPANWSNLVLKPGEYVEVKGTLTGMNTMNHTDRGHTTGTPIVPCASHNDHPFDPNGGDNGNGGNTGVCYDTPVEDSDDWNGVTAAPLAQTGSAVVSIAIAALAALGAGASIMITKRNKENARKH